MLGDQELHYTRKSSYSSSTHVCGKCSSCDPAAASNLFYCLEEEVVTTKVNERALVLEMLLAVNEEGQYSHLVLRDVLDKYQYLGKQERAFSDAPDGRNAGKTADTGLCDRSVFQNQSKEK